MGLSVGGLSGIIIFVVIAHVGIGIAYHKYQQKKQQLPSQQQNNRTNNNGQEQPSRFTFTEKQHDALRWFLLALYFAHWIMTIAVVISCKFVMVVIPIQGVDTEFGMGFTQLYFPDGYANPSGCVTYNSAEPNTFTENYVALVFMVFNTVFASMCLGGIIIMQFFLKKGRKRTWLAMKIFMYASIWCAIFSFYLQESDICDMAEDCWIGSGGVLQIFNILMMIFILALLMVTDHDTETAFSKCRTVTVFVSADGTESSKPQSDRPHHRTI